MPHLSERERLLLALHNMPGLGARGLAHLLDSEIPLARLFELPEEELAGRFGLTRRAAHAIAAGMEAHRYLLAPLERTVAQHSIRLLARNHPDFPRRLKEQPDAPALLAAHGSVSLLEQPAVALLFSNGESAAGLEFAAGLAGELARAGIAIASGHNRPGYRASVSGAKAAGGARIIALDCGLLTAFGDDLDRDLFPAARVWGYSFDKERAVALSPYALQARFAGIRNRERDRLVALLAHRIVAVEVKAGGRMIEECRAARARGTPVTVWAPPAMRDGNRELLDEGCPELPANVADWWG